MVECGASGIGQRVESRWMTSQGIKMDSGLCDQISNVLEMMVRSCPFKNACVDEFVALLVHEERGSVAGS